MFIPLSSPDISNLEKKHVRDVLDSGILSSGPKQKQFEDLICRYTGMKYAVAMNSGTSALHVAVKALGLKTGDEVITTPYSFIASSNCLVYEGIKPVFVDIDGYTLNLDTTLIENKLSDRTKAILPVHIFGQTCDMDAVLTIADKYKLFVIEDACEALGASWGKDKAGTIGNVGVYAFYPNKQITTGEGGVLVTNSEQIFQYALSIRNQGRAENNDELAHMYIGYNYRMSELQAAVGVGQMERLPVILSKREQAAHRYLTLIKDYKLPVQVPFVHPISSISWFVFIVILPEGMNRAKIIMSLQENGIQTKPYFPVIHLQECYRELFGFRKGDFPVSEEMALRTLAIPFHSNITLLEQQYVIRHLSNALEEAAC
ncbi:MAG: DegT/DnrJ/EryC1/StrS family aminotransferase [Bacillota bacterium]|nr:DegT/DnrJ/EryC1/StrS family aminotransferase [Bacillota bacterium]MDW7684828.1 DegT/DnrJ/EryC1/StrS family aminotransferase [Bacillota bacterium]